MDSKAHAFISYTHLKNIEEGLWLTWTNVPSSPLDLPLILVPMDNFVLLFCSIQFFPKLNSDYVIFLKIL